MTQSFGGGINIPIRIGMSPAQAQQAAQATGRMYGQSFMSGFTRAMTGGGNPLGRLWTSMTSGIQAAGYGNYTGPRTPGVMAATYLWRGMFGRGTISGTMGRIGATALGFGALGTLPQAIGEHIQTARVQEQQLSDLNRRTGETFRQFSRFRELVLDTGKDLGYTRDQIIQMTNAYISGVGRMDKATLGRNLGSFMGLSRAYGIDPQAIVGLQTQMGRAGGGFGPSGTNAALAAAIEFGGMRGRENEVVSAIEDLTQLLEQRLPTVTASNAASALGLMTAMNATGNQGLMGARGVGLIGSINQFATGGAGGPRQNLMFQMIQAQRTATGQAPLSYAALIRQASEGIGNAGNLSAIGYGVNRFLPGGEYRGIFLSQMLGISPQQADALTPVLGNPQGFGGYNALQRVIGGTNVNAMSLPFVARALGSGGLGGAQDIATEFAGTMSQRTAGAFLGRVRGARSPEEVARIIAEYGDSTQELLSSADQTTKAFTDFSNSLTDLAGQLNKVLKDSLGAWTNIFNLLGGGAGAILDITGASRMAAIAIYSMTAAAAAQGLGSGMQGLGNLIFGRPSGSGPASLMVPGVPGRPSGSMVAGMGARATAPLALALSGIEAASDIAGGADPMFAIMHRLFTGATTIGGAALGTLVGGPVGTAVGGIGGNLGGEAVWQNLIAPNFQSTGRGATGRGTGVNPFDYPISGDAFGVYSSFQRGAHTGVDFGLPQGTPIGALGAGTIIADPSGRSADPTGMGGNWLNVDYGNGIRMRYAHLSRNDLLPIGSRVSAGDRIAMSGGAVGAEGSGSATTGPHLLVEAWRNGKLVDPMSLRPDMHNEVPMTDTLATVLQTALGALRLQGRLDLTVSGAASGQYSVPITVGGGTMAGILNGSYGGG